MTPSPDIQYIKGVGPAKARLFNKLGVFSVSDILTLYPTGYMDLSPKTIEEAPLYEKCTVLACVTEQAKLIKKTNNLEIYKATIADKTGSIRLIFFNTKYSALSLKVGEYYFFYGNVDGNLIQKEMVNPYIEKANGRKTGGLVPIYPLTAGLSQNAVRKTVDSVLNSDFTEKEILNKDILEKYSLIERQYAIRSIHRPQNYEELEKARKRLVFEEMLIFNGALRKLKDLYRNEKGEIIYSGDISPILNRFGFELTDAQKRTVNDCAIDMKSGKAMNRLIQGDVGCGKTAVAMILMYMTAKKGLQSALMAPTEVLATQHYSDFVNIFEPLGIKVALLTGSMTAKQKRTQNELIQSGEAKIIIGTHSLISDAVKFYNLSLIVTDEQHRFGVRQRKALENKGNSPHLLFMSATPIPRTLAMVLYAELDISVIDSLPPNRKPVKTYAVDGEKRQRLYSFVRKHIDMGRQAYVICAKAVDDEKSDLVSVKNLCNELENGYLKDIPMAFIHGKMSQKNKDEIMNNFANGKIKVLVSTSVVEVGVNVPNATVMVIENAERFGLSSLHQLRGRVGRGAEQSFCILLSDAKGDNALSRLDIMTKTNDGFEISRRDLEIRGPGEFFGQRQSGLMRFQIANLITDINVISISSQCIDDILKKDPLLESKENCLLAEEINKLIKR